MTADELLRSWNAVEVEDDMTPEEIEALLWDDDADVVDVEYA